MREINMNKIIYITVLLLLSIKISYAASFQNYKTEKVKIADSRKDITSTRLRKKKRSESYSYRIKSTSSSASKSNLRISRSNE